ncbi:MAG TPA: RNA chaperone Hfq [Bryobacterales bacterium]|nr:RNA chaperone Hfq [Bryobacterales bacterium]
MNQPPRQRRPSRYGGKRKSGRAADETRRAGPPDETFEEAAYLKRLVEERTPIVVRLRTNEEFTGVLEYFDANFIRLTRKQAPNLFIYKHEIKYMTEQPEPAG